MSNQYCSYFMFLDVMIVFEFLNLLVLYDVFCKMFLKKYI